MSFIASSPSPDNSANRTFGVSTKNLDLKSKDSASRIKNAVSQIISQNENASIKEVEIDFETNTYKMGEIEGQLNPENKGIVDVKIVSISSAALPKTQRTLKEIWKELSHQQNDSIRPIQFLWSLALYPYGILKRLIEGPRPDPSILKEQHDFKEVMKWGIEALDIKAEDDPNFSLGAHFSLSNQLKEMDKPIDGSAIKNRFDEVKEEKRSINLALINAGYYENGKFNPAIAALYKTADGKMGISIMSYGDESGPSQIDFVWDKEPELNQINELINRLRDGQKPPKNNVKGHSYFNENLAHLDFPSGQMVHYYRKLVQAAGAQEIDRPERRVQIRQDPWKLLQETIRLQFPETSLANKTLFTYRLLNDRLQKLVEGEPRLNTNEKRALISKLAKDLESLERQILKGDASLSEVSLQNFESLKYQIDTFRRRVSETEVEKPDLTQFDNAAGKPIEIKVRGIVDSSKEVKSEVRSGSLSNDDMVIINKVRAAADKRKVLEVRHNKYLAAKKETDALLGSYNLQAKIKAEEDMRAFAPRYDLEAEYIDELKAATLETANRIDKLLEEKKYQQAIDLYNSVMYEFPGAISASGLQIPKEARDAFRMQLLDMTKGYWEAKVKLNQLPLTIQEKAYVMIAKRVQMQMGDIDEKFRYADRFKEVDQEDEVQFYDKQTLEHFSVEGNNSNLHVAHNLQLAFSDLYIKKQAGNPEIIMAALVRSLYHSEKSINPIDEPVSKEVAKSELDERLKDASRLDFNVSGENEVTVINKATQAPIAKLMPNEKEVKFYFSDVPKPEVNEQFAQMFVPDLNEGHSTEDALNSALVFAGDPTLKWQLESMNYARNNSFDEVFDLVIANPHYLELTESLIRIIKVLNKEPFGARIKFELDETYINNTYPLLKNLIDESIKNGQLKRASALLYMISHMYIQAGKSPPAEINAYMLQVLDKFNSVNLSPSEKIDTAAFIVSHFSNDISGRDLNKIEALKDPAVAGKLLNAISVLSLGVGSATIPFLATGGMEWARVALKPYLDSNPDLKQAALIELGNGLKIKQEGLWKNDPDNPDEVRQGNSSYDLLNFRWVEVNGVMQSGLSTKLPQGILSHPDYQTLFKGKDFNAGLSSTTNPAVYLYKIHEDGKEISLFFNPGDGTLVIEKEGYQYVGYDSTFGAIFRNKANPEAGFAERNKQTFDVAFSENKIHSIETEEGYVVVNDPILNEAFSSLDSRQVVFCSDPSNPKKITNIRILGQGIELVRDENGWKVEGGPFDRLVWKPEADLNPKLKSSLLELNMPIEKMGLPLFDENTGHTQLIVFPDGMAATRISFKAEGGVETSTTGYLYLAKLYLEKKQYEKAALYIDKAKGAREANSKDLELLKRIANEIHEIPVTSARSALLKIKAELAVIKVERERVGKSEFNDEKFIERRNYVSGLYDQYKRYAEKSPVYPTGQNLNNIEEKVYKLGLNGEEIHDFIAYFKPEVKKETKVADQVQVTQKEFRYLFARMDAKRLKEEEIKSVLNSATFDKRVISHFFEIWNYVLEHPDAEIGNSFLYAAAPNNEMDLARRLILSAKENKAPAFDLNQLDAVYKLLPSFSLTRKYKGPLVDSSLEALAMPFRGIKLKEKEDPVIDIAKIDLNRLGPDVKAYLENPENMKLAREQKFSSLSQLSKFVKDKAQLDMNESARKIELNQAIQKLESKKAVRVPWEESEPAKLGKYTSFSPGGFKDNLGHKISPEQVDNYAAGLKVQNKAALNKIRSRVEVQNKIVDASQMDNLRDEIRERKLQLDHSANTIKDNIIANIVKADRAQFPLKLRQLLKAYEKGEKEVLFDAILDAYQTNAPLGKDIENDILNYLLLKTEANLLGVPATKILNELDELKKQNGADEEWSQASFALGRLLKQASNRERYIDNGKLIEPRYTRKFLVAELRNQIILTKEQVDLIKNIDKNPTQWFQLMMGGGKTSTILPIALLLIADKGSMAVGLLKAKLAQQGLDSLDKSTRLLLEKAGILFEFKINDKKSAIVLQEEYLRLLQIREDKGYVITTIESKAAIEHKIMLLRQKIREDNPDSTQLDEELHWLIKIRSLLKSGVTMGDEIDDIINIKQENNLGIGNVNLNDNLCRSMKAIMMLVYNDSDLREMRNAILNESQSELKKEKIERFKELIVEKMGGDKDYILGNSTIKEGHNVEMQTALKKLLTRLPLALSQKPGMQVGVKLSDGFTIGPLDRTDELEGTFFGKEEDVVINHFILYSAKLPETPFMLQAWNRFYEKNLEKGRKIQAELAELRKTPGKENLTPVEYLNSKPEFVEERLDILQTCIIDTRNVKRSDKQYVLNHQELVMDEEIGGVSGTMDPYTMPTNKLKGGDNAVQVETSLRLAMSNSREVKNVSEENYLAAMDEHVGKKECKAIINEGYALKGMNALEVVTKMRNTENGKVRDFVFIHPKSRKMHIWKAGHETSYEISPQGLQERLLRDPDLRSNFIAYYAPTDTRGVDIKVPGGYGVLGLSSSTNKASLEQAELRLRELGELHSLKYVSSAEDMNDFESMNRVIEEKTEEGVSGDSLKSVIVHMQSAVSIGTRAMLATDNAAKDKAEYWSNANKERRVKDRELENEITAEAEKYLIHSKATPLNETVTREYTLFEKLSGTIEKEEGKIKEIKGFVEKMKVKYPEQSDRIKQLEGIVRDAEIRLAQIKNEYLEENKVKEAHAVHLPSKISTPETSDTSLEQVNEEQVAQENIQESQNVQEASVTREVEEKEKMPHARWTPVNPVGRKDPISGVGYYAAENETFRNKFGLEFHVTESFLSMFNRMPKVVGEPVGRFMVVMFDTVLINSDNYQLEVKKAIDERGASFCVYTPLNGVKYQQSYKLNKGRNPPHVLDAESTKKIIQGKWMMGYTQYNAAEKAVLSAWLNSLSQEQLANHRNFTKEKGTIQLQQLFEELVRN